MPASEDTLPSERQAFVAETRAVLTLAAPLMFGQIAVMGMAVTDAVIAGHASTTDLAGIALAGSIWGPLLIVLIALVVSVNPILAGHFGANRLREMGADAMQGLWLATGAGLGVMLLANLIIPFLTRVNAEHAVIEVAQGYLGLIAWGAPALGVQVALRAICETSGYPRITMQVHAAALLVNAGLDYLLVFGMPGIEPMGGAGCGLASALVYCFILLAVLTHILRSGRYHSLQLFRGRIRPNAGRLASLLKLGLPMAVGSLAETGIFSVCAILIAGLGTVALAAHQVAMSMTSLMFMLPLGLSMALTIRVAQGLGAGSNAAARLTTRTGIALTICIAASNATLIILLASHIAKLYSPDPVVIELAVVLLGFAAAFQFADGLQICCTGLLRGYRDTFVPMLLMLLAFWPVGIGSAVVLGFNLLEIGISGVGGFWLGLVIALTSAYLLLVTRLRWLSQQDQASAVT